MEIYGLPTPIVLPAAILVLLAVSMGVHQLFTAGTKRALVTVVRVMVYGAFAFFVLVVCITLFYYSTGGH
jgi:hypothetical protein